MIFLADETLGRLIKWLRLLGFDTKLYRGPADRVFLRKAAAEGRIALSRRRDLSTRQYSGQMMIIGSDRIEEQLKELIHNHSLPLDRGNFFQFCIGCNKPLETISRQEAGELVPGYVFETEKDFRRCSDCGKIFWAGTHHERALSFLVKHNLIRPL
jgi:uncharacterized protein with PIN domain